MPLLFDVYHKAVLRVELLHDFVTTRKHPAAPTGACSGNRKHPDRPQTDAVSCDVISGRLALDELAMMRQCGDVINAFTLGLPLIVQDADLVHVNDVKTNNNSNNNNSFETSTCEEQSMPRRRLWLEKKKKKKEKKKKDRKKRKRKKERETEGKDPHPLPPDNKTTTKTKVTTVTDC